MNFLRDQYLNLRIHLSKEDGIGVIEMILLLVVLVALVMLFKTNLNTLLTNIFSSINSKSKSVYS